MFNPKVIITPYQPEDLQQVVGLLNRELHADPISFHDFERKVLHDPNFRPEGALTAREDDCVVGFMLGIVRREPLEDAQPDFDRGWITLMAVGSESQGRGIGTRLLDGVTAYLRSEGAASVWVSPYAPNYFAPGIDEAAYPGAIEFLRKRDFEVAYRPLSMEASLDGFAIPDWARDSEAHLLDQGVRIEPLKPVHAPTLTEFVRDEFPGDWQRIVREHIRQGKRSECLVAMEGGRCIGFARHDGERFGPFGVARSERGRGLGAVLLSRCLEAMSNHGLKRAWFMWTDDRAARLYARVGFRETRRFSVMSRSL